jgi:hypothetical protein
MALEQLTPMQEMQRANMDGLFPRAKGVSKDPATRHTNSMRAEMEKSIKATGSDRPVTLLNLNPIELSISGGMFHPEVIPACPLDQPYVIHVFRETRWGHKDKGIGLDNVHMIDPFPEIPKRLAGEYMKQYQQEKDGFGGVLCYVGDHHPSTIKKGQTVTVPVVTYVDGALVMDEEERDFHELLGIVRTRRNQSLMHDIQQANGWYENDAQRNNVNDSHRDKARMAKREGLIDVMPRWVLVDNLTMEKQPDPCPSCAVVPKAGAILCINCNHIFNVVAAYKNTRIAYGCAEFDRLTAEEWKEVNIIKQERDKMKRFRLTEAAS